MTSACLFSPADPVACLGPAGSDPAQDHVGGAGLPAGGPECGAQGGAAQTAAGAGAHCPGPAHR